jgi:hypothetical protein
MLCDAVIVTLLYNVGDVTQLAVSTTSATSFGTCNAVKHPVESAVGQGSDAFVAVATILPQIMFVLASSSSLSLSANAT